MGRTLAYIRISTNQQDTNNQKLEILEWARKHDVKIDDFIEVIISSRKTQQARRLQELDALQLQDTVIVTELSRLGRSTIEVIGLVNDLLAKGIRLVVLKQNLDLSQQSQHDMTSKIMITLLSLFAELERDMLSLRTKEALSAKKQQGVTLGKPKGTIQASQFDKERDKIVELLKLGLSIRKIATLLSYPNHRSLNTYVKKRKLRDNL